MKRTFTKSRMKSQSLLVVVAVLLVAGCSRTAKNGNSDGAKVYSNPQQQGAQQPNASNNGPAASTTGQPSAASDSGLASAANGQAIAGPSVPTANASVQSKPAAAPLSVPAGTVLSVRLNQGINVKTASTGESFTGTIVNPISANGEMLIPAGSTAEGIVLRAHRRGRFKGASILQLRLTGLEVNNRHYQIDTRSLTRTKKGKGRRTAAFIGGGSGLGMLIGGVATGGVGLLVGGLAGAGAGTAGAAFTGNRDINLPAESVVSFRLSQALLLR